MVINLLLILSRVVFGLLTKRSATGSQTAISITNQRLRLESRRWLDIDGQASGATPALPQRKLKISGWSLTVQQWNGELDATDSPMKMKSANSDYHVEYPLLLTPIDK